jgi:N-acylglucosamine-6-phosphate 2-epimerase
MRTSTLKRGLYVSCQATENDPFYGSHYIGKMAQAAEIGGAVGLRINSVNDIIEVKKVTKLPVIGIIKKRYPKSLAYITPTLQEVEEIVHSGADVVCIDGTQSLKPGGETTERYIEEIKKRFNIPIMADVSNVEEGILAYNGGADIVATTLAGYGHFLKDQSAYNEEDNFLPPDFHIIEELAIRINIPIFAEGRFWNPEDVSKAIELGAHSVVVGSAITRPQLVTKRFTYTINKVIGS